MKRFEEVASVLVRVSGAVGVAPPSGALRPLLAACGWGERDASAPLLPSTIRHGKPYGVSFVVGAGAPEVRVFIEPQADPPSPAAYLASADRALDFVRQAPGADLTHLDRVRDLFTRIWLTVAYRNDAPPAYRVYLCFSGDDAERARVLRESLARLGLEDRVSRRPDDRVTILSLDLHASPRTKAYVLMPGFVLDHPFGRAMPGGDRPMGWLACHFLGQEPRVAWHYGAAVHAPDDDALATRLRLFLGESGIDPAPYDAVRAAIPFRHHFVSYQRIAGAPRVTVYLHP